jgi:divalent metal cation (Fe/Co/Zn/Cd) transporter
VPGHQRDDLEAGLRVSALSITWTVVASVLAVVLGLRSKSLVLIAFGLTGILDGAGSTALVVHFRHALRHDTLSTRHEHVALAIVILGLLVVAVLTISESIARLTNHGTTHESVAGIVVAAASIVVLGWLSNWKRRIARRIPSRALLADSRLSATGCLLAVVTVAGTVLTSTWGWWWVDPTSALVVALGAAVIGAITVNGERNDRAQDP